MSEKLQKDFGTNAVFARRPWYKRWWIAMPVLIGFFIAGAIGYLELGREAEQVNTSNPVKTETQMEAVKEPPKATAETPPRPAMGDISGYSEIDLENLLDDDDIKDVSRDTTSGVITVAYETDVWDENATVIKTCEKAAVYMEALFRIDGVETVQVAYETTFTDAFGEKYEDRAVSISIERKTAAKLQWESVNAVNSAGLLGVADKYYFHPVVEHNLDNADIRKALQFRDAQ